MREFTAAHKKTHLNTVKRKRAPHLLNHDFEEGIEIDGVSRDPLSENLLGSPHNYTPCIINRRTCHAHWRDLNSKFKMESKRGTL